MSNDVTRRTLLVGATGLATASSGRVNGGERDESETVEDTYDVDGVSELTVDGHSGVSVRAEDRDDVAVTGEKRAASEDGLDDVRLEGDREDDTLALRVDRDGGPFVVRLGPGPTMDLTVRVPSDLQVERVETPNGDVTVTGVGDLSGAEEFPVTVGDGRREISVTTTNGDVLVRGS